MSKASTMTRTTYIPKTCLTSIKQRYQSVGKMIDAYEYNDSFYSAIGLLADFFNEKIKNKELTTVKDLYLFAHDLYKHGDSEVQNAIGVSFIEHLQFETDQQAKQILSNDFYMIWKNWQTLQLKDLH
jgi:hypothetical protein